MAERLITRLSRFPWATFGKPELAADLFEKIREQAATVRLLPEKPLLSLVAAVSDGTPDEWLEDFTAACRLQSYPEWELWLIGSGARAAARRASDPRVTGIEPSRQATEAGKKQLGVERSSGEWVVFFDPRDVPSPALLYRLACRASEETTDGFFANEAWLTPDGKKIEHFFSKPELQWFNLLHFDPVGIPWAARRSRLIEWGGFRPEAGTAHQTDLLLRACDAGARFVREPQFLTYRRSRPEIEPADQAEAARASLDRRGSRATVKLTTRAGRPRVDINPSARGVRQLSVILCFRDKASWVVRALQALETARGNLPIEVILVDNESSEVETTQVHEAAKKASFATRIVSYPYPFHFGEMNNWAVREYASGELLLLLNNDVFWKTEGGLETLAGWAAQDWVGTVGMRLTTPSGALQYGGLRAHFGGASRLARIHHVRDEKDFALENHITFANTFAVCCLRRSVWEKIGGFRRLDLANGYGDVAFNFECLRHGLTNLYLGQLEATHLEGGSRGARYEYWEECLLESQYAEILGKMLRDDLGLDRVPEGLTVSELIRNGVVPWVSERAPWLTPLKRTLRQSRWVQSLFQ